jgi:hypothetical protein
MLLIDCLGENFLHLLSLHACHSVNRTELVNARKLLIESEALTSLAQWNAKSEKRMETFSEVCRFTARSSLHCEFYELLISTNVCNTVCLGRILSKASNVTKLINS